MIYVATRAGNGKTVSEDRVLVGRNVICNASADFPIPARGFVCVADGVGGNTGGAEASEFVVNALMSFAETNEELSKEAVTKHLWKINSELLSFGQQQSGRYQLATTLTGVLFSETEKYLIHIGNTRAYVVQAHFLKQLTYDHTVSNWLKSMGRIDEAEQCNKNEITNCFGGGNETLFKRLDISSLQAFHTMLLTSDGVHDFVSVAELEQFMSSDIPGNCKCERIVESALSAGSQDDLSVVIINSQEG
ncbi:Serine/threonine phosphatase stp [Pelotomaculum schinkii]|uniref:Serine/threonine phosphatase stp n=1 Tax=Pelotomaculum schinkii TaxID=78350 RepID=A0A4Y7RGE8_9FIRM|nr:PP2C family serine/threonine-protein phosphatase [Pelotomaculum schinkii]TEB07772.1 Serine/threonine phosphatase stp [Pelotomaculum schinkii]